MGETLGISHNVFEKMERERDRKERLKKYEDWQKEKVRKKQKLRDMRARIKEAEKTAQLNGGGANRTTDLDSLDDDLDDLSSNEDEGSPSQEVLAVEEDAAREAAIEGQIPNGEEEDEPAEKAPRCGKCNIL